MIVSDNIPIKSRWEEVRYNPFKDPWFQSRNSHYVGQRLRYSKWMRIEVCDFAVFGPYGSSAWFHDPDYEEFECDCMS